MQHTSPYMEEGYEAQKVLNLGRLVVNHFNTPHNHLIGGGDYIELPILPLWERRWFHPRIDNRRIVMLDINQEVPSVRQFPEP